MTDCISRKRLIARAAEQFHTKPAVVFEGRTLTFSEVDERASRLANGLRGLGLGPKARIATLMNNCMEYPEIEFGLVKGSYPQVTLNTRLTPGEILFQLNETGSTCLLFHQRYLDLVSSIRDRFETVRDVVCLCGEGQEMLQYDELLASAANAELDGELTDEDIGEIRYTSGTTGRPKGVLAPYRTRMNVTRNFLMEHCGDMTAADRFVALQPLYHGAGYFTLPVFLRGATQYITSEFDPKESLDLIESAKITFIKTVPTVLIRILDVPDIMQRDLSSVRTVIYGGSAIPAERLRQAQSIFGPVFANLFGQLESAMTITWLRKEDNHGACIGSVGRPCMMVDVRIVDENGSEVPPGEIGEVVVKGDHNMIGYLDQPEATAKAMRDGWLYTNDLGRRDRDGFIFLTGGRKSQMIKSGGLVVYPAEVEEVLYQHPAVAECAVIGVPDPTWIEAVKACIVLKEGAEATEQEVLDHCKKHLAGYKKPKSADFLTELPHNAAGKVVYAALRDMYGEKQ